MTNLISDEKINITKYLFLCDIDIFVILNWMTNVFKDEKYKYHKIFIFLWHLYFLSYLIELNDNCI